MRHNKRSQAVVKGEGALKKKILLVEDNPQNMRLMEMLLKARGCTLLKATDGEKALEMASKDKPDLIIMDMNLPGMSGLDVTRKLRQMPAFSRTPIIAVTAYAMKGDKKKFLDAGCSAYMPKPIDTRELPKLIAQMLSKR